MKNEVSTGASRHAILIMAHNNWYSLGRLLHYFDHKDVDIYLHVEKRAKDFNASLVEGICKHSRLVMIKRRKVNWGTFHQIACEMNLYEASFSNGPYGYYHLISGNDVPLQPLSGFLEFFSSTDKNFIISDEEPDFESRLKIYYHLFNSLPLPGCFKSVVDRKLNALQVRLGINRLKKLKQRFPKVRQGHNWCSLTNGAVAELLENRPLVKKFFSFANCADEMYKQTVLSNSGLADKISHLEIREIDWSAGGKHPATFLSKDFDSLERAASQGRIFARKFDEKVDKDIISKVYALLAACP